MSRLRALPAVALLGLFLAACGGDDGGTAAEGTTTTTEEGTTSSGDDATTTAGDEPADDGDAPGAGSDLCEAFAAVDQSDPQNIDEANEVLAQIDFIVEEAPDEVGQAANVLRGYLADALALAEAGDGDVDAALDQVFDEVDEDAFAELADAGQVVSDFASEECGLDDGTDDTAAPDVELGDPTEPPTLDDPEEAELASSCFDGDLDACDQLWLTTEVGSIGETYGATCGGRLSEDDAVSGSCSTLG